MKIACLIAIIFVLHCDNYVCLPLTCKVSLKRPIRELQSLCLCRRQRRLHEAIFSLSLMFVQEAALVTQDYFLPVDNGSTSVLQMFVISITIILHFQQLMCCSRMSTLVSYCFI
uniref:Putative secreted protein n=1 Tax=Ixodes ricinus TaxID=34613 RepID=A0A6B0UKE7_IXORI